MEKNTKEQAPLVVAWPPTQTNLNKLMGMIAWGRNKKMLEAEKAAKNAAGTKKDS